MTKQKKIEFLKSLLEVFERFPNFYIGDGDGYGNITISWLQGIEEYFDCIFIDNVVSQKTIKRVIKEIEGEN